MLGILGSVIYCGYGNMVGEMKSMISNCLTDVAHIILWVLVTHVAK
jgi:hypothetical protein